MKYEISERAKQLWQIIRREKDYTAFCKNLEAYGTQDLKETDILKFIEEHEKLNQFDFIKVWMKHAGPLISSQKKLDYIEKKDDLNVWNAYHEMGIIPSLNDIPFEYWSEWGLKSCTNLLKEKIRISAEEQEELFLSLIFENLETNPKSEKLLDLIEAFHDYLITHQKEYFWNQRVSSMMHTLLKNESFYTFEKILNQCNGKEFLDLQGFVRSIIHTTHSKENQPVCLNILNQIFEKGIPYCGGGNLTFADGLIQNLLNAKLKHKYNFSSDMVKDLQEQSFLFLQYLFSKTPQGEHTLRNKSLSLLAESDLNSFFQMALEQENFYTPEGEKKHLTLLKLSILNGQTDNLQNLLNARNPYLEEKSSPGYFHVSDLFLVKGNAKKLQVSWTCLPTFLENIKQSKQVKLQSFYDNIESLYEGFNVGERKAIDTQWHMVQIWTFRNKLLLQTKEAPKVGSKIRL